MVMAAAPIAGAVAKKVLRSVRKKGKGAKGAAPRRRRQRLLTLGQREELMWISRHIGKTAAAERMMQYRRR